MALSAAMDSRRHRIGSTRTKPSVEIKASPRPRASPRPALVLEGDQIESSLNLANTLDQRLQIRVGHRPCVDRAHCVSNGLRSNRERWCCPRRAPVAASAPPAGPQRAHERARLPRRIPKDLLSSAGEAFPRAQRHDKYLGPHRVLGQGVVGGELVMAGGDVGRPVVLRAVDQSGREPGRYLAVGSSIGSAPSALIMLTISSDCWTRIRNPFRSARCGPASRCCRSTAIRNRRRPGRRNHGAGTGQDLVADRPIEHLVQVIEGGTGTATRARWPPGIREPIGATLVRLRSMAPTRVCSMVSFSSPELARVEHANAVAAGGPLLDQAGHELSAWTVG